MKMKICKYCKKPFHPSKYSPHQVCCNHDSCRKARDAERQKNYYRKNIQDSDWKTKLSERKKQERFRRLEAISHVERSPTTKTPPVKDPPPIRLNSVSLPPDYDPLIFGILGSINGSKTYEELVEFRENCIKFGMKFFKPATELCPVSNGETP